MLTVIALACAAAAAALVFRPTPPGRTRRPRLPGGAGLRIGVAGAAAAAVLVVRIDGIRLGLALIGVGAAVGAASLVARGRRQRAAQARQAKVVEVCEALVGELRAGLPPVVALAHCVEVWPDLSPVVATARLGGDVSTSMRRMSELPGAGGMAEVAGAWQVSERSGTALSQALGQVAQSARARETTRHVVRSELASAQATARTVAALPVLALGMASGVGADPWHFLLGTVAGLLCLGAGLGLALLGLHWIDRISAKALDA